MITVKSGKSFMCIAKFDRKFLFCLKHFFTSGANPKKRVAKH
jgi:hypothetical protein